MNLRSRRAEGGIDLGTDGGHMICSIGAAPLGVWYPPVDVKQPVEYSTSSTHNYWKTGKDFDRNFLRGFVLCA